MSTYNGVTQETLMDPSTAPGTRELPTLLDYAAFKDVGWQVAVTAVPEPETHSLIVIGLGFIGFLSRRRLYI